MGRRSGARAVAAGALALGLATLVGCSNPNSVQGQANAAAGQNYVAGDGTVQQIAVTDRRTVISVSGVSLEGAPLDSSQFRGKVVVVNTWGSWCPPCNAEAPVLQRTWAGFSGQPVQFLGIDLREGPAAGRAFQRRFAITYPSLAWDGGKALLQLKGKASATPTTLVLDREGRLAGRISGATTGNTLRDMVRQVLAEPTAGPDVSRPTEPGR